MLISGHDPYEIPKEEWQDNMDTWPAITYGHVCMYLILYPSPYTKDDMLKYKSLDSFQNFQKGRVREVLIGERGQWKKYAQDLPSPELFETELRRWKRRFIEQPADTRPSSPAKAIKPVTLTCSQTSVFCSRYHALSLLLPVSVKGVPVPWGDSIITCEQQWEWSSSQVLPCYMCIMTRQWTLTTLLTLFLNCIIAVLSLALSSGLSS